MPFLFEKVFNHLDHCISVLYGSLLSYTKGRECTLGRSILEDQIRDKLQLHIELISCFAV